MKRFTAHRDCSLLSAVAEGLSLSRRQAKNLIDQRRVLINRERVQTSKEKVYRNDTVTVTPEVTPKPPPYTPLFETPSLAIYDKPAGLLTNEDPDSFEARLQGQSKPSLQMAHRLDRETSGCIVTTSEKSTHTAILRSFKKQEVTKTYLAIVVTAGGTHRLRDRIRVKQPVGGRAAITEGRVLHRAGTYALVKLNIPTGRTHQIRIHMESLYCPVLGDKQYGYDRKLNTLETQVPRHMLHAWKIDFPDPTDPRYHIGATAPIPSDFAAGLKHCALRIPTNA